jgi:hypothetical protein
MANRETPWIVAGGKIGEIGHCERCGEGLELGGPQRLEIVTAAMNAFVGIHKNCSDTGRVEPKAFTPREWLMGRDTGISSRTIYSVMMNQVPSFPVVQGYYNVPHDPDDFGRCHRLLVLFPEWRQRLPEVVDRFPEWGPMVREWDQLTKMFTTGFNAAGSDGGKMYKLMRQLEEEGRLRKVVRE